MSDLNKHEAGTAIEQSWQPDSDMVFKAISTGNFDDYKMAERAVVMLYVPDMRVSRAGICHALKRLERLYKTGES